VYFHYLTLLSVHSNCVCIDMIDVYIREQKVDRSLCVLCATSLATMHRHLNLVALCSPVTHQQTPITHKISLLYPSTVVQKHGTPLAGTRHINLHYCYLISSFYFFYLFIKQFHKNVTADNTRTGPTRLAKHSQWPQ